MDASPSRPRPTAVLIVVLAVLVLGLGAGAYAVAAAVLRPSPSSGTSRSAGGPAPSESPAKDRPLRGRLTAISGGTWTVQPAQGSPVTVMISDTTKFGTKKSPSTAAAFPVGTRVAVIGPRVGDRVEAKRITAPQAGPSAAPSG